MKQKEEEMELEPIEISKLHREQCFHSLDRFDRPFSPRYQITYSPPEKRQCKTPVNIELSDKKGKLTQRSKTVTKFMSFRKANEENKSLLLDTIMMKIKNKESFHEIEKLLKNEQIIICDDFSKALEMDIRLYIWSLQKQKRIIIQYLCQNVIEKTISIIQMKKLLFSKIEKNEKMLKFQNYFIQYLIDHIKTVFTNEGDPYLDENGNILTISPKELFTLALTTTNKQFLSVFNVTYKLFCQPNDIFKLIKDEDMRYREIVDERKLIDENEFQRHERFEKIVMKVINIESELPIDIILELNRLIEPQYYSQKVFDSLITFKPQRKKSSISYDIFQENTIHKQIENNQKEKKKLNRLSQVPKMVSSPLLISKPMKHYSMSSQTVDHISTMQCTLENLFSFSTFNLSRQLILYQSRLIEKIKLNELYSENTQCHSLLQYQKSQEKLKNCIERIIEFHGIEGIGNMINTASLCAEMNDFSTSYLIFSVLKEEEKLQTNKFNLIVKRMELETHWNDLNDIFNSFKNYKTYRETYKNLSSTIPRIPLMTVWFQDFQMVCDIQTFYDEEKTVVNFEKLKLFRELFQAICLSQSLVFNVKENNSIQHFFDLN